MKRTSIDTSIAAYHALDAKTVSAIKDKILEALKRIGKGSSQEIADYLGMDYDSVWRRCSDLKNERKIFASEYKVLTKKNRFARQWMLCDGSQPKTEKALKGKPTLSDYSRKINDISKSVEQLKIL